MLAQKVIGRQQDLDHKRMLAMGLFSGTFTGCGYHFIFNVAFSRIIGQSTSTLYAIFKTAADAALIFPFLYMPTFYFFEEAVRYGRIDRIVQRWRMDITMSMNKYVKIWPAAMLCVFTVVPAELRVTFIAAVSFGWLIVLSVMSH